MYLIWEIFSSRHANHTNSCYPTYLLLDLQIPWEKITAFKPILD